MIERPNDTDVEKCVRGLGSFRRVRREKAEQALRDAVRARLPEFLEAIERELRTSIRKRRSRQALRLISSPFRFLPWLLRNDSSDLWAPARVRVLAYGALTILAVVIYRRLSETPTFIPISIAVAGLGVAWTILIVLERPMDRRLATARKILTESDDVRVVGTLANWVAAQGTETEQTVLNKLKSTLPKLSTADSIHFTAEQRAALIVGLDRAAATSSTYDPALAVAILKGLEHIGQADCIPVVRRLAGRDAYSSGTEAIRDTARVCLQTIEDRAAREDRTRTLLRPALAPDSPDKVLMRPAGNTMATDPDELLRPVEGQRSPNTDE